MKRLMVITMLLMCLGACKQLSKDGLSVEYDAATNILTVNNFIWSYGTVDINQFSGDFKSLDKEVFNTLQGKSGVCIVRFSNLVKDQYGNDSTDVKDVGQINITELSKYQGWEYWSKAGGIQKLIYAKYIQPQDDKVSIDTAVVETDVQAVDTVVSTGMSVHPMAEPNNSIKSPTYTFTLNDLYPIEEDRLAMLGEKQFQITGKIIDVNPDPLNALMKVQLQTGENAGEQYEIMFYPLKCSSYNGNQLLLAAKIGSDITAVISQAGASSFNLVSATIEK